MPGQRMSTAAGVLAACCVAVAIVVPAPSRVSAQEPGATAAPDQDTTRGPVVERAHELPGETAAAAVGSGAVVVEPAEIVAGMFYAGATIHVSAVVPQGAAVTVLCHSEGHPLTLKRKGKALGLLWLNVGDVSFEDVPTAYLLATSRPLTSLAPDSVLEQLDLGFVALASRCDADASDPVLFSELVRLKQKERLWTVAENTVAVQPAEGDAGLATTDITLPPKAGPGEYEVLVYAFQDERPELIGSARLRIRQAGVTGFITDLATDHGLLYGILAATVAIAVGLLTGLVFGMGSKGH